MDFINWRLWYVLSLFALLLPLSGFAQTLPDSLRSSTLQSAGIQLTTTGPGIFYARELSQLHRLSVVVRGQYAAYRKRVRVETEPGSELLIDPDFMIGLVQAGLNWHPFRRGSFFLTGGVGYTWHPYLGVVASATDKLTFSGLELTPEDVGVVNLTVRWRPVVGYAGWGFGRIIPRKRWGVGFEMGVFYLGRPRVDLHYEGFLETTTLDEQVSVVEHNLRNYRYLPSLNFRLAYKLTR